MSIVTSRLSRGWLSLLALGSALTAAAALAPSAGTLERGLFVAVVSVALIAALAARRITPRGETAVWGSVRLSLFGFLAGELVWLALPKQGFGPFATIADLAFLLSTLPLGLAAVSMVARRELARDRSAWLEAGILTVVGGVISWQLLMAPLVHDAALNPAGKLLAVARPLTDVVVLGLVLRLVLSREARDASAILFAAGTTLLLGTNLVFCRLDLATSFRPGSAADALWLASYLLVGFAGLVRSGTRPGRGGAPGRVRLAVVLVAVFVPELILLRALEQRDLLGLNTPTVATGASIVVVALATVCLLRMLGWARQAELDRGEARLSALILHSADAIFLVDHEYRISFASPSAEALRGRKAGALHGTSLLDWFVDEHREVVAAQFESLASSATNATVPLEGWVRAADGQIRALEGVGRNLLEDANVRAIVVTLRDTTTRRELEQQLERRAFHDDLTGLANRALFADRLSHALKRKARDNQVGIGVLFVDLDDFKAINDGMGHSAGDELIRGVAERIRTSVRPGDTVARLGGDEFAVLVEDTPSAAHVLGLAERLLEVLLLPIDVMDVSLAVMASIGVTIATPESTTESLLRDADIAMYNAKSQGKGRVAVFDASLREVAVQRLALKIELPKALRSNQFKLVYQPIKHVSDQRLTGVEALVRWHHPTRGLVPPAEFIQAAEETGMIVDLGRWVLKQACEQATFWNQRTPEPLTINVNVSGLQLQQPGFVDEIRRILATTGLSASLLTLELTESVLVKHQRIETILGELRAIGIGIAIDDFGTGYSSLSYLQQFPATSIKIDRSFVADLAENGEIGLVRSIISIGNALGMTTVAEGVETLEQLELLKSLGCNHAQGFLLGRPQTAGEIDGTLEVERMARTVDRRLRAVLPSRSS